MDGVNNAFQLTIHCAKHRRSRRSGNRDSRFGITRTVHEPYILIDGGLDSAGIPIKVQFRFFNDGIKPHQRLGDGARKKSNVAWAVIEKSFEMSDAGSFDVDFFCA
jgi:hypothetical protein